MINPRKFQIAQMSELYCQPNALVMRPPYRTEGMKGTILKMTFSFSRRQIWEYVLNAIYLPLDFVGAISEVAASAVSSSIPAPIPLSAMPPFRLAYSFSHL